MSVEVKLLLFFMNTEDKVEPQLKQKLNSYMKTVVLSMAKLTSAREKNVEDARTFVNENFVFPLFAITHEKEKTKYAQDIEPEFYESLLQRLVDENLVSKTVDATNNNTTYAFINVVMANNFSFFA